ncbi:propionate--CoA ligase [Janthinobacterium psychrotolerans]|uniref:Propionate--CoA ligase n=1 Tax=Janthinobacterium psychrotolerans TaxID=1747903 RepID=A0A1A7BXJ7_9BURK|nr:propionate--CoA ligase [Janthinobacterium psychrotolerans]OBV38331.1 propionyl-CoA synthetase [Janthinobacterium psychrotolerans]
MSFAQFYQHSIDHPDAFWREEAKKIDWHTPFDQVLDDSRPPFAKWFVGGTTNLCHNAVDRWVGSRGDAAALIAISTETNTERSYSYRELQREVERCAAILLSLGVARGDRVLIYMPMIAEAAFAMLACARIGAIHSVVFGGFASNSLASRIDDAQPKLVFSSDAGSRNGKAIAYKPLLDEAIRIAAHQPEHVLLVDRHLVTMERVEGRDVDYATLREQHLEAQVPITWLESNQVSYVLYTSGTTGKPKGVQRDVGGYAVALASSMQYTFCGKPGETFFATSDIGWVVGHSYIVYGPLIAGMATILYEGLPVCPDAGIWWSIVEKYRVTRMFSAPTAIRVLRKHPVELMRKYDLSSLKALYLAGEPLDETTSQWIAGELKVDIIDNYWQTETGWPILSVARGVADTPTRLGSPGLAMYGYKVKLLNESTGEECGANEKGVLVLEGPLPPGCLQTVYGDDQRFVDTYWSTFADKQVYSTFDWGLRDADGYYFILGRTDDVINVAGHRLGTREIEESISSHPNVSEVAVVGMEDKLKGQVAMAFVILKDARPAESTEGRALLEREVMAVVDRQLGAVARPARVLFVPQLPKTRSGKLLRRSIQAICEGRSPGDLTSIEDPASLQYIKAALA